jgi:hypothetical protein
MWRLVLAAGLPIVPLASPWRLGCMLVQGSPPSFPPPPIPFHPPPLHPLLKCWLTHSTHALNPSLPAHWPCRQAGVAGCGARQPVRRRRCSSPRRQARGGRAGPGAAALWQRQVHLLVRLPRPRRSGERLREAAAPAAVPGGGRGLCLHICEQLGEGMSGWLCLRRVCSVCVDARA